MRKIGLTLISLLLCLSLCSCSLFFSETADVSGFRIAVNSVQNCCFVGRYECKDIEKDTVLTVPDSHDGIPITRIGGYFGRGVPMPFCVDLSKYINAPENSEYGGIFGGDISKFGIKDKYTVKEVVFTINIGENIAKIENVVSDDNFPHIEEDGSITFYHPVYYINCSEKNKYFYSEKGKLYSKKTKELISDFDYIESDEVNNSL